MDGPAQEPVPGTPGCLPRARGWFLGLMLVQDISGRHQGGERLRQAWAGWHTQAQREMGEAKRRRRVFSWFSWSPQVDPLLCPDGKSLSWGYYTEKPLWGISAVCQGENFDSIVALLREEDKAWVVGRRGQQNRLWALGSSVRSKDNPGEHPSPPQHNL